MIFSKGVAKVEIERLLNEVWLEDPIQVGVFIEDLAELVQLAEADSLRYAAVNFKPISGDFEVDDHGVMHVDINGQIMRKSSWLLDLFGIEHASIENLRDTFAFAMETPDIKGVFIHINSPGGTSSGIQELADEVYALAEMKPVHVHTSEQMASAAYFIGSQASRITAEKTAAVGSIGAYMVVRDTSKAAEYRGIKVHVIKSGDLKGIGIEGAPVTEPQLKALQESVDRVAELFTHSVARGRKFNLEKMAPLATGRDWLAMDAVELGLIDEITSYHGALSSMMSQVVTPKAPISEALVSNEEKGMEMSDKRVEELEAELKALREEKAQSELKLTAITESQKAALIEGAVTAGKVTAAMRPSVEAFAKVADISGLTAFLAGLPVVVNLGQVGGTGEQNLNLKAQAETDELSEIAGHLGITLETIAKFENIKARTSDGKYLDRNGKEVR